MSTRVTRSSKRSLAEADLDVPEPVVQEKKSTRPAAKDIRSYFGGNPEPSTAPQSTSNSSSPEPQRKKAKTTAAAAKKSSASSGRKPPAKKAAAPSSAKAYKDAMKAVDKVFNQLMKQYKLNPKGWASSGVTSDDFAAAMAKFLPEVKKLQETSLSDAFNLLTLAVECLNVLAGEDTSIHDKYGLQTVGSLSSEQRRLH